MLTSSIPEASSSPALIFVKSILLGEHSDYRHPRARRAWWKPQDPLETYYIDFSSKLGFQGPWDRDGAPLTNISRELGYRRFSIDIAQYALGAYQLWQTTKRHTFLDTFLEIAVVLRKEAFVSSSGLALWLSPFSWRGAEAGWRSAMSQGLGLSVMLRAYLVTGNLLFRDQARAAFQTFLRPVEQGGIMQWTEDGHPVFKEIIGISGGYVLNGSIFSLWGLFDYVRATDDPEGTRLRDVAVRSLSETLPTYHAVFWSLYDTDKPDWPNYSSLFYHQLHIVQLEILHDLTGVRVFLDYARRWRRLAMLYPCRVVAVFLKALHKLMRY